MLARRSLARAAASTVGPAAPPQARNMATLREIELRLKSVRNIEKITKSMKMIASTKLAKAQRAMQAGKAYGLANSGLFSFFFFASYRTRTNVETEVFANVPSDKPTPNKLFVVISSDKGLCGGIHSSVSKATRRALANAPDSPLVSLPAEDATADPSSPIMIIGDKSKGQLMRTYGENFQLTFNQIGRDIPTFADAAAVADMIVQSGVKYDSIVVVYNKFVSAISYESAVYEVKGEEALKESSTFPFLRSYGYLFLISARRV